MPICSSHNVQREWKLTIFTYHDGDVTIEIPDVYGWVCPVDGEASFTPEVVDEIIVRVRAILAEQNVPEPPPWHEPVLLDRKRQIEDGQAEWMTIEELKSRRNDE